VPLALRIKQAALAVCLLPYLLLAMNFAMFDADPLKPGLRVLVVDGHADSRFLLTTLFELYGVQTTTATCVREAIDSLHQSFPDLLISELLLLGEDGYALISQVKILEALYQVQLPAIALTVCTTERDQIHALTAGFCRHLAKPLDIDELLTTIAGLTASATV